MKNIANEGKEDIIILRIQKSQKEEWKKRCEKKKISLTSLIINSVEGRMMNDERRQVLAFIENQDNIFKKIETNINQVARIVNGQKYISSDQLKIFNLQLENITQLKQQQNEIFKKIYSIMSSDS